MSVEPDVDTVPQSFMITYRAEKLKTDSKFGWESLPFPLPLRPPEPLPPAPPKPDHPDALAMFREISGGDLLKKHYGVNRE